MRATDPKSVQQSQLAINGASTSGLSCQSPAGRQEDNPSIHFFSLDTCSLGATLRRRFGETLALANANQIEETKKAWEALLSETKEGMRK